jgi:hypothetical protein
MQRLMDTILTVVLTLAALAVGASVVHRSFFARHTTRNPSFVKSWENGLENGLIVGGSPAAKVRVVELTDMECPACKAFHRTLVELISEMPEQAQFIYMSYPLDYHANAMAAARATECVPQGDALVRWLGLVYDNQDSLSNTMWGRMANEAGIADTARIVECANNSAIPRRIAASLDYGKAVGFVSHAYHFDKRLAVSRHAIQRRGENRDHSIADQE